MAMSRELPFELCAMIVRFLVARRIDHFDPVVAKDLQSLRLASPMVSQTGSHMPLDPPVKQDYELY